jgi:putative multiple sugar transport system permease protein
VVPLLSIVFIIVSGLICAGVPVGGLVWLSTRRHPDRTPRYPDVWRPFVCGALAFTMAQMLTRIPLHVLVLPRMGAVGEILLSLPVASVSFGLGHGEDQDVAVLHQEAGDVPRREEQSVREWPMAILVGLAVGILVGIWQGYWVAYVGIPAFIVTLAGMLLFRGLQLIILNAESITVPDAFQKIANGYLPEIGQNMPYHLPTLLLTVLAIAVLAWLEFAKRRDLVKYGMTPPSIALSVIKLVVIGAVIAGVGMLLASYKGIPIVGLILLGLVIIYSFVTQRTVIGRHIYAVGGNSNAARLSGVDTRKVDFFVMVNMAFLAAIAGMVFTAYLNAANPKDGVGFELDAIAAVFIGGAAVAGGVGTVTGSMIGGLVMGVLNLGLANLSVDSNTIQVIKGLVLLGAVAFDVLSKSRGKPSFIGMIMSAFGSKPDPTPVRANEVSPATGVTNVSASHADSVPEGMTSEGSVTDEPSSGVGRE